MQWALVVPVKRLATAKSRLRSVDPATRQDLALAFALDTVTATLACPAVDVVAVVTDDPRVIEAVRPLDVEIVPDLPDAGLNPALAHGVDVVSRAHPQLAVGALSADLPALRPEELTLALRAAEGSGAASALVSDRDGLGTTLLLARTAASFAPQFGARSRAAHRAAGVHELELGATVSTLRSDVDTDVDLWEARRLGVGPHTAARLG